MNAEEERNATDAREEVGCFCCTGCESAYEPFEWFAIAIGAFLFPITAPILIIYGLWSNFGRESDFRAPLVLYPLCILLLPLSLMGVTMYLMYRLYRYLFDEDENIPVWFYVFYIVFLPITLGLCFMFFVIHFSKKRDGSMLALAIMLIIFTPVFSLCYCFIVATWWAQIDGHNNCNKVFRFLIAFLFFPFTLILNVIFGITFCVASIQLYNSVHPDGSTDTNVVRISLDNSSTSHNGRRTSTDSGDVFVLSHNVKANQVSAKVKRLNHIEKNDNNVSMTCTICSHRLNVDFFDSQYLRHICCEPLMDEEESNSDDKFMLPEMSVYTGEMCVTECGHYFHFGCIEPLLKYKQSCPSCGTRASLVNCRIIYKGISNETSLYYMRQVVHHEA